METNVASGEILRPGVVDLAERLAGSFPEAYADITQDAAASQLRALEVDVRGVRETGRSKDGPRSGCYRAELERLAGSGDA